jgi:transposase
LFDEAEVEGCDSNLNLSAEAIESEETVLGLSANITKAGRKPIPKGVPRIIIEHDLTNAESCAHADVKNSTLAMKCQSS